MCVYLQVIRDRKNVLEEQIKKRELVAPMATRKYLDFLDILLTSKVVMIFMIHSKHTC